MAIDLVETISDQMDFDKDTFPFYTDSRIILGYISNYTRRLREYVANRVRRIRSFSKSISGTMSPLIAIQQTWPRMNFMLLTYHIAWWFMDLTSYTRTKHVREVLRTNHKDFLLLKLKGTEREERERYVSKDNTITRFWMGKVFKICHMEEFVKSSC